MATNIENSAREDKKSPNEDVSTFSPVDILILNQKRSQLYDPVLVEKYDKSARTFEKFDRSLIPMKEKIELAGKVDPEKRNARGNVNLTVTEDGFMNLSSWGIQTSFSFYENKTQDRFALWYDNKRFPVSSYEHAAQVMNLVNSIAHASRNALDAYGNKSFFFLSQDASPVKVEGDSIIFKGTVNNVVLYTGTWSFLPTGMAQAIANRVNRYLNNVQKNSQDSKTR